MMRSCVLSPRVPVVGHGRALLAVAALALPPLAAQTLAETEADRDVVRLPAFSVNDERSSAYGAKEAISTTRISVAIQDVPQTVSVVTRELMNDTLGQRMLDTAKYVTPIMESSLTSGGDRVTLRGFQVTQRFIDGVNISGVDGYNMASDTTNVERIEIIKGPNAILVPGGSPGGIMNQITKSPVFRDHTELTLTLKEYLGNIASVDANRVFNEGQSAVRLVVSGWDSDGYFRHQFREGWLVAPSFTHVFGNDVQFTSKLEALYNKETQGIGAVIDPSVGTDGYARVIRGMPRDNAWGPHEDNRERREVRWLNELNFKLGDTIAARLWLMGDWAQRDDQGAPGGVPAAGYQGARNPLTGKWEPFTTFGPGPTYTRTTVARNDSLVFNRVGQSNLIEFHELHFKNDYAAEIALSDSITSTTIGGLSANYQKLTWKNWSRTRAPIDLAQPNVSLAGPFLTSTLLRDKKGAQEDLQVFVYERLEMFDDRLILAGGVSKFWGTLERLDGGTLPATRAPSVSNDVTDTNLGVIFKPVPSVSLFAGYNRVGGALPTSILAGEVASNFLIQTGDQLEAGVKTSLRDGRITASLSYFDITQDNFQVPNSAFNTDPTQPQFFFQNLTSEGVEFELNAMLTRELILVGNFTHLKMRDPNGVRQRMVPDYAGALFAKYEFSSGNLKGFGVSLGLDYMGDAPGEQASGITAASTPTNVIPNQPSFYVASRTLFNLGFSYSQPRYTVRLNIENLLDEDYIQSAGARNVLIPGVPRTWSLALVYRF